jgi:hypothetical protein
VFSFYVLALLADSIRWVRHPTRGSLGEEVARAVCGVKNRPNTFPKINSSTRIAMASEKDSPAITTVAVIRNCMAFSRAPLCDSCASLSSDTGNVRGTPEYMAGGGPKWRMLIPGGLGIPRGLSVVCPDSQCVGVDTRPWASSGWLRVAKVTIMTTIVILEGRNECRHVDGGGGEGKVQSTS